MTTTATRVIRLSLSKPAFGLESSGQAWDALRKVELPSGVKVPVQLVHAAIDTLVLLYKFDDCSFDALVRACRAIEAEQFGWGLANIPFLLESFGFIDKNQQPYPLIKGVVLLCVEGDNPIDYAIHYPKSEPAWEE